jgi:hypothetical protein
MNRPRPEAFLHAIMCCLGASCLSCAWHVMIITLPVGGDFDGQMKQPLLTGMDPVGDAGRIHACGEGKWQIWATGNASALAHIYSPMGSAYEGQTRPTTRCYDRRQA